MSGFAILNSESKILRRAEKQAERKEKLKEKVKEVNSAPKISNWADASDSDEREMHELQRPVSDSESEASSCDSDIGPLHKSGADSPKAAPSSAPVPVKEKPVSKKAEKKNQKPIVEEDMDAVLKEFGLEISEEPAPPTNSKSKKKKKDKVKQFGDDSNVSGQGVPSKGQESERPQSQVQEHDAKKTGSSEDAKKGVVKDDAHSKPIDPAAKQAAIEALRKKAAAKSKPKAGPDTDVAKFAKAEAQKRAAGKKNKKDKASFDL